MTLASRQETNVPKTTRIVGLLLAVLFGPGLPVYAQTLPPNVPTKEQLAKDNNLFLSLARKVLKWDEPTEPIKIVGPLYFVGTMGLSSSGLLVAQDAPQVTQVQPARSRRRTAA
jgi:hypothetical protein